MIESIEKLREFIDDQFVSSGQSYLQGMAIAGSIEREIAERYMLLPVDADGVSIHVGDTIEYPNGRRDVVRFITVNDNMPTFNERGWVASKCRHVKPRTIEDVLRDLVDGIGSVEFDALTAIGEAADEIRELMEVDR